MILISNEHWNNYENYANHYYHINSIVDVYWFAWSLNFDDISRHFT